VLGAFALITELDAAEEPLERALRDVAAAMLPGAFSVRLVEKHVFLAHRAELERRAEHRDLLAPGRFE
jgi:hypothetical protein